MLRLSPHHFIKGKKCFSICDICRDRGLEANDYFNYSSEVYAEISELVYFGANHLTKQDELELTSSKRKLIESIIAGYDDASVVVKKGISRHDLNQQIIAYENNQIQINDIGSFFDNLAQLGFQVDNLHDLQKIDYTSRMLIYNRYHNRCQYCGRKGFSIDHMKPVSSGGSNDLDNLTLSCRECNKLKRDMPYEWFVEFNLETRQINQQLVIFEHKIDLLVERKEKLSRELNAYMHRTGITVDERTTNYRDQIKAQQGLLDGLNSDYNSLRELRKSYINARFQMYKLEKRER
ncbi:HNH endonuclease signature motif containing protein [Xylocopilactobacillus apis]|uniref:HNH endonuclease n=1 Tax=Xylocopilactobacillus apis TaxID=2932183 RepID=UPI002953EAC9|nr:HNH endonuclease signature motif containing protein [Xylocopilactobacillus apis]